MAKASSASRARKRIRKNVTDGIAHIQATFNNTIVTITDRQGNTLSWATAGGAGFKGSRKSTPFAAQMAADIDGRAAMEYGIKTLEISVMCTGPRRVSHIRDHHYLGILFMLLVTVSPVMINRCQPTTWLPPI